MAEQKGHLISVLCGVTRLNQIVTALSSPVTRAELTNQCAFFPPPMWDVVRQNKPSIMRSHEITAHEKVVE